MNPANEHRLYVGESLDLKKHIIASSTSVFYCGFVNDHVFSVAVSYSFGNNMMAYNLYFPANTREIKLKHGLLRVKHVTTEQIIFDFEKL